MNTNIQFSFLLRFIHIKYIVFVMFFGLLGCTENSVERNPFLFETRFDQSINLALPAFDNLNYQGGVCIGLMAVSKDCCYLISLERLWRGKQVVQTMRQVVALRFKFLVLQPHALAKIFSTVWLQVNPLRKEQPIAYCFIRCSKMELRCGFIIRTVA